ncbi:aspartate/glutamate racemase family protein [Arenibaculum pallidiluteum]|uniref:aspartate/glutamate racemase family protein n=1 Tax=Arenibaculum pallidiluteum TaxID=2812559 RepID=UPI001A978F53|nr:aspartate/glutamate racemase family protein [Arenibaculum pallidiluteum]
MRAIGLLGGMSWESTAVYYRIMNEHVRDRLGALHSARLLLNSYDFAEIAEMQARGEWHLAGERLACDARKLQELGAAAIMICTNTMHEVAGFVEAAISVPLLHIVDPTAEAIRAAKVKRPALLATRFTMERRFYVERMGERFGIDVIIPDAAGREVIHTGIYDELCRGIVSATTRQAYLNEIERLSERGADSVIFGCTEIGLLLDQKDVPVPVFDTTRIHAVGAVDWALS